MQTVLSNTLSLRRREIRGDDVRHYYELFPQVQPLTQEREDELVAQALTGCRLAEDTLARQYAGVGISMALRCRFQHSFRGVDVDSLVSAALLGIVEGIRHFDTNRGARLITCVWWWVMCYLRRERNNHRFVKHGPTTYVSDFMLREQEACPADQPDIADTLIDEEEKGELHRLMADILDDREIEILNSRYASCKEDVETLSDIGERLDVSRQRVSQIEERAIAKLQRAAAP